MAAMAAVAASSSTALVTKVEIGNAAYVSAQSIATPKLASARVSMSASTSTSSQSRRSMLSLLAATVAAGAVVSEANADALKIKLEGPPLPSGGLPGTDNADQARDTDAPLKERFFLQSLEPAEALARAKESAEQIIAVKGLIEKKAWPYVQNDLRSKAGYLRFDLTTVINAKPKEEKKELTALTNKLYDSIAALDYAARMKKIESATKSYDETVELLKDVFAKA